MSTRQERDKILGHDYDGIREYDNPLPGWWLVMFYLGIATALVYVPYYHMGPGPSAKIAYEDEVEEALAAQPKKTELTIEELALVQKDSGRISAGDEIFTKNCVSCHAAGGAGLVGPNLTDEFWIHGGAMKDVVKTITVGVPEKGMISWKDQLSMDEIASVAAYVKSLKGTKPVNPKAPEGNKYEGE